MWEICQSNVGRSRIAGAILPLYITLRCPISPKNLPLPMRDLDPCITWLLVPTGSPSQTACFYRISCFCKMHVRYQWSDRWTERTLNSAYSLLRAALRANAATWLIIGMIWANWPRETNRHWSSYIGCRLSKELHISCVCWCTISTSDKYHNTYQTVSQLLQPVADTNWGRLAQLLMFCQEQELDLANVVSFATLVQLPVTPFWPSRHCWH